MTEPVNPVIDLLLKRRSVGPNFMAEPGPSAEELTLILTAAARVPDHKKLVPWRFILFEGAARAAFGNTLSDVFAQEFPELAQSERLALERSRFMRAPLVAGVVSRTTDNPAAPEWEQILSAGAACQNFVIAANGLGYRTAWITEWYAYSAGIRSALGLMPNERMAGFIYVGSARDTPPDRDRPKLADIVSDWNSASPTTRTTERD
jgi:nitroreductase